MGTLSPFLKKNEIMFYVQSLKETFGARTKKLFYWDNLWPNGHNIFSQNEVLGHEAEEKLGIF